MPINVSKMNGALTKNQSADENKPATRQTFSAYVNSDKVMSMLSNTLKDPQTRNNFVANIVSVYSNNPGLVDCKPLSIVSAGLMAQNLSLSLSPTLAYAYLLPFKNKRKDPATGKYYEENVATFSLSWRGYYQLAIRSGQFKVLNAIEIKEGELKKWNPLTEEIEVELIDDEDERDALPTIGYYAYFETTTGFRKGLYWSKKKVINHAATYVPSLVGATKEEKRKNLVDYLNGKVNGDAWKYSSFYYKNFDQMAIKTMYRQLFKFCPMSVDMQNAVNYDEKIGNSEDITDGLLDSGYPETGAELEGATIVEVNGEKVNPETGEVVA